MKKLLIILLFFISCGGNEESTTPSTTTTTTNPNLRSVSISVWDDSIDKKYELVKIRISDPDKFTWTPDLEYGSDSIPISKMEIGQIGQFTLVFDYENNEIPICFSPTEDSKGMMGMIFIVLNDNDIEIDGLAVQDIVIDRNSKKIKELNDSSKPNC